MVVHAIGFESKKILKVRGKIVLNLNPIDPMLRQIR